MRTWRGIPSRPPRLGSPEASAGTSPPMVSASLTTLGTNPLRPPSQSSPSALTTPSVSRSMTVTTTRALLSGRRLPLQVPLPVSAETQGYGTVLGSAGFHRKENAAKMAKRRPDVATSSSRERFDVQLVATVGNPRTRTGESDTLSCGACDCRPGSCAGRGRRWH